MPYLTLCFKTPILTQSHAPIHSPQKLIEYNIDILYTSINFTTHAPAHNYPNDLSKIFVLSIFNYCYYHPRQENTVLINIWSIPSQKHLQFKKILLCHLFYNIHIKTIPTLPSRLQNLARYFYSNDHRTHL